MTDKLSRRPGGATVDTDFEGGLARGYRYPCDCFGEGWISPGESEQDCECKSCRDESKCDNQVSNWKFNAFPHHIAFPLDSEVQDAVHDKEGSCEPIRQYLGRVERNHSCQKSSWEKQQESSDDHKRNVARFPKESCWFRISHRSSFLSGQGCVGCGRIPYAILQALIGAIGTIFK